MIDLRSDTITKPTEGMLAAIAAAEVGDAVFGDDPTANELERRTAEILGKEAAIFVPSGTMANQVAIRCHTEAGDEMFCEAHAHVYLYEGGAAAALSGVQATLLPGVGGVFAAEQLKAAIRPADPHFARARLVCVENTHNRGGGTIWPIERIAEVHDVAREAGLAMHLDGARLWNASVASGVSECEYAKYFDSVSVCFSKGLGAPIGSALAGSAVLIGRAKRFRKMFGGGMRQVGIIAAAALYALDNHRDRLAEDHANAKRLAEGVAASPGVEWLQDRVDTNLVFFRATGMSAGEAIAKLLEAGVGVAPMGEDVLRATTSLAVTAADIEKAIDAFGCLSPAVS